LLQVHPEKRHEFIQSMEALLTHCDGNEPGCRSLLLQAVADNNLFCLMVEYEQNNEFSVYIRSDRYHALLGAATVLGKSNDLAIVEYQWRTAESLKP
jgi:quinol monooxygenase YgiN